MLFHKWQERAIPGNFMGSLEKIWKSGTNQIKKGIISVKKVVHCLDMFEISVENETQYVIVSTGHAHPDPCRRAGVSFRSGGYQEKK